LGFPGGSLRPLKPGFEGANLGLMAFGGLRQDDLLELPRQLGFEFLDDGGDFFGGVEGSDADVGPELGAILRKCAQVDMAGQMHGF
jgi:hypothetical protein